MERSEQPTDFPVVGIGASAGGITALQTLFSSIPAQPGLAFVVVQHLAPDVRSHLVNLMTRWCALRVSLVEEGAKLERDHLYLAPPGCSISVERGVFSVRRLDPTCGPRAGIDVIDAFLESLATDVGPRAVAVVLSGTGADGAAGVVCTRKAGGMVLVQDPTTAMYEGMPAAAIATGAAHHILPLGPLAQELVACASPGYVRSSTATTWSHDVARALDDIVELIRTRAAFDLAGYKTAPLLWRIQRRMDLRRVALYRDYETLLHDDPAELGALVRAIPIHVTEFFRDAPVWQALERDVIPRLFEDATGGVVRAWTPACSTGEEAYSVAMLLAEHASTLARPVDFQVFATDASAEIVACASRGLFQTAAVSTVSPERRQRFFHAAGCAFRVQRMLREKMVFVPQDLLGDPPLAGLDLVTCRNLLIYLEPDAARRVAYLLHASLRMGGYLVLGNAEMLSPRDGGFEALAPGSRTYRKIGPMRDGDVGVPRRPTRPRISAPPDAATVPLQPWSEALRVSHDELDASREELQALNVELRASNDQLNSANADLQHANSQLQEQLGALDMQRRVLGSGAVMTLFLDEDLRIRWFTAAVTELFPLLPADVGRRITDIVQRFDDPRFIADVRAVMASNEARELEVQTTADRWFLRRIGPHRSASDQNAGVAVTFSDVTERKRAEARQDFLLRLSDVLRSTSNAVATQSEAMRVLGRHLRVARARYHEVGAAGGLPADVGPDARRAYQAGRGHVVEDRAAAVGAPVLVDGALVAIVTVSDDAPRRWSRADVALVEETAMRVWTAAELSRTQAALRESEERLATQNEAFQAAMDGASLPTSLGILIRAAIGDAGGDRRCAFYLADPDGTTFHHVAGVPESARGDYQVCWSYPVETAAGKLVGSFAMYAKESHEPTARDRELAAALTHTAAIIIAHQISANS